MSELDAIRARAEAYATHGTPGLHAPQDRAYLLALVDDLARIRRAPTVVNLGASALFKAGTGDDVQAVQSLLEVARTGKVGKARNVR